jgi:hypothetical protein
MKKPLEPLEKLAYEELVAKLFDGVEWTGKFDVEEAKMAVYGLAKSILEFVSLCITLVTFHLRSHACACSHC